MHISSFLFTFYFFMFTSSYSFYIDDEAIEDSNEPPLSDETCRLGEGVNGRRRRPTAALDEADAVIGDGALAGIAGAPAPAPLAVIVPVPAEDPAEYSRRTRPPAPSRRTERMSRPPTGRANTRTAR